MDRKGFLKRVFGAAVVAAMPKVVVDQIENLPPPESIPPPEKDVLEYAKEQIESSAPDHPNCRCALSPIMYLYNKNELIATSIMFNVELRHNYQPVQFWYEENFDDIEYAQPASEWYVQVDRLDFEKGKSKDDLVDNELNALFISNPYTFNGNVYLTAWDIVHNNYEFQGNGALTMEESNEG